MKKVVKFIQQKTALLLAITFAAIVGGATTAVVLAAIPNSQTGQINACYRNQGGVFNPQGSLRAIDVQSGQSCTGNETALNWDQEGVKAYAHVVSAETSATLDSSRSKNISSFTRFEKASGGFVYCFELSTPVKNVSATPVTSFNLFAASVDPGSQEWTILTEDLCSTSSDGAVATSSGGGGDNFYVSFH